MQNTPSDCLTPLQLVEVLNEEYTDLQAGKSSSIPVSRSAPLNELAASMMHGPANCSQAHSSFTRFMSHLLKIKLWLQSSAKQPDSVKTKQMPHMPL